MVHPGRGLQDDGAQQDPEVTCSHDLWDLSWLMAFLCRYFDENSWGLELVHKEETVSTLSSLVQPEVVSQVFHFYTLPVTGGESDDFSVHQEKVSR